MEYVIDKNIRVSNNSWGGGGDSQGLYDVIEASQTIGHIFVASAGNNSENTDQDPHYPSAYDLPNIISVAATDNDDNLGLFPSGNTSNYGPTTVDLGAPGVNIYSIELGDAYGYHSGTSMASPHVTGVVALIMSRHQEWTWQDVRNRVLAGVRPVDALIGITATGGVLNAAMVGDCNANGIADELDIAAGTSDDCSGNGIPDECEPDCNGNDAADSCDVFFATSEDCNGNVIPDDCEPDCNSNGVADSCDLAAGTDQDCNTNLILDDCDIAEGTSTDCNLNDIPDDCEMADGTVSDCDGNGVPDICEDTSSDCNGNDQWDTCDIAQGLVADCNDNGVPDECDLAAGTSADCNENELPDDCESAPKVFVKGMSIYPGFLAGIADLGYAVSSSNVSPSAEELDEYAIVVSVGSILASKLPALEAFVEAGGGLIIMQQPSEGLPYSSPLHPVESTEGWENRQGTTIVDQDSPLVVELGDTSSLEGVSTFPTLKPGASTAVAWDDGTPMAVAYAYGAGNIAYFNDLWAWYSGNWRGDPLYGMTLMRNALRFVCSESALFDCNHNGVLDLCDLQDGASTDWNGNAIPDECDACGVCSDGLFCNGAEWCDVNGNCQAGTPPCDSPEFCDEDAYQCQACMIDEDCADGLFCNGIEICAGNACTYGDDPCPGQRCREYDDRCVGCLTSADCDDGDWCNGSESCDPEGNCQSGLVTSDCNGNGIEDPCDITDGWSPDCNHNTVPDECDIVTGALNDEDGDGVPDICAASKNRYISFGPSSADDIVAYRVTLTASADFPDSSGLSWWLEAAGADGIARLTEAPVFRDWSADPRLIHIGDCPIVPVAAYEIQSTPDGIVFSDPVEVATIGRPGSKHWGDLVGEFDGTWTKPNGIVNFDDVVAVVKKFEVDPNAPHFTWVDVESEVPNAVVNMTDVQLIIFAFEGALYPFSDPADCS